MRIYRKIVILAVGLKEYFVARIWLSAVFILVIVCFLFAFDYLVSRRTLLRFARQLAIMLGLLIPANLDDVSRRSHRNMIMDQEGEEFWPLIYAPFLILALLGAVFVIWDINRGIREDERDRDSE